MLRDIGVLVRDGLLWLILPFLPARPRQRLCDRHGISLGHAALASGILEIALGGLFIDLAYQATWAKWNDAMLTTIGENVDSLQARGGPAANPVTLTLFSGPITVIAFLLTPQGFLSVLTLFEGIVRAAFASTGEPVGSVFIVAPYHLALGAARRLRDAYERATSLPPRPDRVRLLRGKLGSGYRIASDRSKPGWNRGVAVFVGGTHYLLARAHRTRREGRPVLLYLLRPWPPGAAIRRQLGYDPEPARDATSVAPPPRSTRPRPAPRQGSERLSPEECAQAGYVEVYLVCRESRDAEGEVAALPVAACLDAEVAEAERSRRDKGAKSGEAHFARGPESLLRHYERKVVGTAAARAVLDAAKARRRGPVTLTP